MAAYDLASRSPSAPFDGEESGPACTIAVTLVLILLTQLPGCWIAVQKLIECSELQKNLYGVTVCY